ncbi:MAG: hypothetical protein M3Q89_04620 [Verrucomicrobiota bacterium]|nr:hypothetical protein [Verrucomicrobiota bacterium]
MSRATPQMRELSQRLIAYEARENKSPPTGISAIFRVCDKLRSHLGLLLGNSGFRALLSRALVLSHREVPWLSAVQTKPDGLLDGLDEAAAQVGVDEMDQGSVVLVTQLLGLLMNFIGEDLTLRMVRELWPKLSLNNAVFEQGDRQ